MIDAPAANDPITYRRDASIAAVVLAAILVVVFSPFLFGGWSLLSASADVASIYVSGATADAPAGNLRSLDPGAAGWHVEPGMAASHNVMFGEHRLPFWDPDGGYGKPFAGAMVPQQFYPLSTLVAIHPSPRTYAWWVVARLLIAGVFAAMFVRLFFAGRWAAVCGGIATMFTGYFLLYYGMPHLSVEVELPMMLWATEIVARRPSPRRVAALAIATGLVVLGGMPESALLVMATSTLYAALRVFTVPGERKRQIGALLAGNVLGVAIGAVELLPFVELLQHGASNHDPSMKPGLGFDGGWRTGLLTEFFPRIFGNPWTSILTTGAGWSGVRGFFGASGFFFAVLALAATWRKRDARTPVITFLVAIAAYSIFKRYGNPVVNWTGALPLFVQLSFAKYIEAILGTAAGMLVGFGVGYLREREGGLRALWIAFGSTVAIVSLLFAWTRDLVPPGPFEQMYPRALLIGMLALIGAAVAGAIVVRASNERLRIAASLAVVLIVAGEPLAGYLIPVVFRQAPAIARNPYAGAPYLDYLAHHMDRSQERLFGISGALFPNWASAYGLSDVRSIEAVALHDYIPFVDAFVSTTPVTSDDQYDRFVATRAIEMNAPLVRRWLALSSVGYIVDPYVSNMVDRPKGSVLDALMAQVQTQISESERPAVHAASAEWDKISESVFFEHPPRDVVFHTAVPKATPRLTADIALDPAVFAGKICGGPITFGLRATRGDAVLANATRTIDPKHVTAQRHWIPFSIDLSAAAGGPVDVHYTTAATDYCSAWAVWGEPRFVARSENGPLRAIAPNYPIAFQTPGMNVFRVNGSLPRFSLFHQTRKVATLAAAVAALKEPSFDIHRTVTIEDAATAVEPARGNDTVTITRARSDEVETHVVASSPAILLQNDSWYPGWKATVDGNAAPILHADGIFRGIPVPGGSHTVVVSYDSGVVLAGIVLSLVGLLLTIVLLADPVQLRRITGRAVAERSD